MERINRKTFQGVVNIVMFNWHYYIISLVLLVLLLVAGFNFPLYSVFALTIALLLIAGTVLSLAVSYYIYDYSKLYTINWLDKLNIKPGDQLLNINAGFDESSHILSDKYPQAALIVFDFYDAKKHTEVSIERARKAYPPYNPTQVVSTNALPLEANSINYVFLILAGHEIRNHVEREMFFSQLKSALKADGRIIVVEHQRDLANFIAFNFGFFHFYSPMRWRKTFLNSGLIIDSEEKYTPFLSIFTLKK